MGRCGFDVNERLEDAKDFTGLLWCGADGVTRAVSEETAAAGGEGGVVEVGGVGF